MLVNLTPVDQWSGPLENRTDPYYSANSVDRIKTGSEKYLQAEVQVMRVFLCIKSKCALYYGLT